MLSSDSDLSVGCCANLGVDRTSVAIALDETSYDFVVLAGLYSSFFFHIAMVEACARVMEYTAGLDAAGLRVRSRGCATC